MELERMTEGNVVLWLRQWAAERPDAPFFKCSGDWKTYRETNEQSDRVAAALASDGLQRGDRVAVFMESRDEYIFMALAVAKCGAVLVPLNKYLKGDLLRAQLSNSGARYLCVDAVGLAVADPVLAETGLDALVCVDPAPDTTVVRVIGFNELCARRLDPPDIQLAASDIAGIVYTSGTTGPSKGCVQPFGSIAVITASASERELIMSGDRVFSTLPLFHSAGLYIAVYTPLRNGDSVVIRSEFHASTYIREAMDEGATMLMGVGAIGAAVLAQPASADPAGATFRVAAFAPLSVLQQEAFKQRFRTEVFGGDGYGQTECSPITGSRLSGWRKLGTIGQPVGHLEVNLFDDQDHQVPIGQTGEIVVRPKIPFAMYVGYWNDPGATLGAWRNLWHHTGDFGRSDEDGFITFVGRKSDTIRRRGENISAMEVERAILGHVAVGEVAVHQAPGDLDEEEVKAVIVLNGDARPSPQELFDFLKAKLPYFAVPRFVEFVETLPKTEATGRVKKHELRSQGVTAATWDFNALGLVITRSDRRSA